jgi:tetraspanin-13/31
MCGSFTCSKNTLVGLNVIYILVSFLMMGVAVHSKAQGYITSLPIVGGITASGVFLLFIAVVGLVGAMKHHQVMLFFYMVVLFFIFIIQFSCSCAALTMADNEHDQGVIFGKAWTLTNKTDMSLIETVEKKLDCCGSGIIDNSANDTATQEEQKFLISRKLFDDKDEYPDCFMAPNATVLPTNCHTCFAHVQPKMTKAFRGAGGLGLFFSFPEFVGMWLAARFRNQKDPRLNPSAFF